MTKEYNIFTKTNDKACYVIGNNLKKIETYQRRFKTIVEMLNFVIKDSWEKNQEWFKFEQAFSYPHLKLQLRPQEYELIQRIAGAYQGLKRNLEQIADINYRLKDNLKHTADYLKKQIKERIEIEQKAK